MKRLWIGVSIGWMAWLWANAAEPVQTTIPWGQVTVPAEVVQGELVQVKVVIKEGAGVDAVQLDLHGRDPQGQYAGFVRWGGGPVELSAGRVVEKKIRAMPKDPKQLGSVHVLVVALKRTGDGFAKIGDATSEDIRLVMP